MSTHTFKHKEIEYPAIYFHFRGYASSCRVKRLKLKEKAKANIDRFERRYQDDEKCIIELRKKLKTKQAWVEEMKKKLMEESSEESADSDIDNN